jgi:hypothetical protein
MSQNDREWELAMTLVALVLLACVCEMLGVWNR